MNYPADQNGHTLTGSITTAATAPDDGLLTSAEILAWEFDITGPVPMSGSSSDAGSFASVTGATITPTEIALPFPPPTFRGIYEVRFHAGGVGLDYLRAFDPGFVGIFNWYRADFRNPGPVAWFTDPPLMGLPIPDNVDAPWVVATRVPEPAGAMLLCSLAGAALFLGRRRQAK